MALRIFEVYTYRLQQTRESLKEMAFNDLMGNVAGLPLRLADPNTDVSEGHPLGDLAAMVGCVRVSFTAVLDRFKHTDAVSTDRKRIQIADRAQLEQVVGQKSDPPGDL